MSLLQAASLAAARVLSLACSPRKDMIAARLVTQCSSMTQVCYVNLEAALQGASSKAGAKGGVTAGMQHKAAGASRHKQASRGSAVSSHHAARLSIPAWRSQVADAVVQHSPASGSRMAQECAACSLKITGAGSAAFGTAHGAMSPKDPMTRGSESVHTTPPSAKEASSRTAPHACWSVMGSFVDPSLALHMAQVAVVHANGRA